MTRIGEFEAFYHESRRHLLHVAYAQSGDLDAAAAGVQDAYAHAWQRWAKIRLRDPLAYVRVEAIRLTALRHNTHILRRQYAGSCDDKLFEALTGLPTTSRRLVVLRTAGQLDRTEAGREVAVTTAEADRLIEAAVSQLEGGMRVSIGAIETRIAALGATTESVVLSRASTIRRLGRRRTRRNTVAGIAAATAAVVTSGFFVTTATSTAGITEQIRDRLDSVGQQDRPPEPRTGADPSQLLIPEQLAYLDPDQVWSQLSTESDLTLTQPYATCQESRFADPEAEDAYVRTFKASGRDRQRVFQAIEVSKDRAAARKARATMLQWYAGCQASRVQLLDTYRIERAGTGVMVMELRQWSNPVRTLTVGVTRTGVVTTAVIHEVDRRNGPKIADFAQTMNDSLSMLCSSSGGECDDQTPVRATAPLPTGEPRGFLGVVDLPPVANLNKVWVGTSPMSARVNPSATLCDRANFTTDAVKSARARIFVIPEAEGLPTRFGISETRGTFAKGKAAASFVRKLVDRISACADKNLSATVDEPRTVRGDGIVGRTWTMTFEVSDSAATYYRLGLVRFGRHVAEVSFSPTQKYDVSEPAFDALVARAGQRLAELDSPRPRLPHPR